MSTLNLSVRLRAGGRRRRGDRRRPAGGPARTSTRRRSRVPPRAPRGELVTALLRSPPKSIRRQLGPAPNLAPAGARRSGARRAPAAGGGRRRGRPGSPACGSPRRTGTSRGCRCTCCRATGCSTSRAGCSARAATWPPCSARTPPTAPRCSRARPPTCTVAGATDLDVRRPSRSGRAAGRRACRSSGYPGPGRPWRSRSTSTVLPDPDEAARTHLRGVRRLVALAVPNPAPRGHSGLDDAARLVARPVPARRRPGAARRHRRRLHRRAAPGRDRRSATSRRSARQVAPDHPRAARAGSPLRWPRSSRPGPGLGGRATRSTS